MSTINRAQFLQVFSSGSIDINNLSDEAARLLERAGVQEGQLRQVAGQDGVISGRAAAKDLYTLVEDYDKNGTMRSLATGYQTSDGEDILSASGELYEALKGEVVERQREAHIRGPSGNATASKSHVRRHGSLEGLTTSDDLATATAKFAKAGLKDVHITPGTVYFGQGGKYNMEYPRTPPKPGERRWLDKSGCGPTSLAIIDATLRPKANTNPQDVAKFAMANKLNGTYDPATEKEGSTNVRQLVRRWSKSVGLKPHPFEVNDKKRDEEGKTALNSIRDQVKTGGLALISVKPGHFTKHGHIMVVNGYAKDADRKEWFFLANPGRQKPEKVKYKDGVVVDRDLAHGAGKVRVSRDVLQAQIKYGFTFDGGKKQS